MNSGTSYGGARGFFIDSLLRMASVKASSTGERARRAWQRAPPRTFTALLAALRAGFGSRPCFPRFPFALFLSLSSCRADKRNLSLLHYTVSAIYAQDPAAIDLPEELPSLDKAALVEFDLQITFALRDLKAAVRRVQSLAPPLEQPTFEPRYPYLHDVGAHGARIAVRLTCAATVFVVVAETHAADQHGAAAPLSVALSPTDALASPAGTTLRRRATMPALASPSDCGASDATPNTASRGAPSPSEPSPLSSAGGGLASPTSASELAALLGVSAGGVQRGVVPAGCGAVAHASSLAVHGGHTYFVNVDGLTPGRRYAAYIAVEDSFETLPADAQRAIELHRKPITFVTLTPGASAVGGEAGAPSCAPIGADGNDAVSFSEHGAGGSGAGDGGARAEFTARLEAMLAKRAPATGGARAPIVVRRASASIITAIPRSGSGAAEDAADSASVRAAANGAPAACDDAEAEQPPPVGPPIRWPDEDGHAHAARAQVLGFVAVAEPEVSALEALEADVRAKLLELGRYFGEPKSNAVEVFGVLLTLKDFLAEFKKVKLAVLEQRKVQDRLAALGEGLNRRRTYG